MPTARQILDLLSRDELLRLVDHHDVIVADRRQKAHAQELRSHAGAAEKLGLSETGFAIYGLLKESPRLPVAEPRGAPYGTKVDEAKTELASLLEEQLAPQVGIVDWVHKDDVQRDMRRLIKRQLRVAAYAPDEIDATAESVVDLLKRRHGRG